MVPGTPRAVAAALSCLAAAVVLSCSALLEAGTGGFDGNQQPIPLQRWFWLFGSPSSAMQLELFFDVNCPVCRHVHQVVLPSLRGNFSDPQLALVLRPFPLPIFRNSMTQIRAGMAVEQMVPGLFARWIDLMFDAQSRFSNNATAAVTFEQIVLLLLDLAQAEFGSERVPTEKFLAAMVDGAQADADTRGQWKVGAARGVFTVPTLFVNDVKLLGDAFSDGDFVDALGAVLAGDPS